MKRLRFECLAQSIRLGVNEVPPQICTPVFDRSLFDCRSQRGEERRLRDVDAGDIIEPNAGQIARPVDSGGDLGQLRDGHRMPGRELIAQLVAVLGVLGQTRLDVHHAQRFSSRLRITEELEHPPDVRGIFVAVLP